MIDLRLGDCLEVLKTLDAGSVDAVVTDPPYGTRVDRDGYGRRELWNGEQHIEGDGDTNAIKAALAACFPLLAPHAFALVFASPKNRMKSQEAVETSGFRVVGELVWDKAMPGLGGGIRYQHETVLIAAKGNPSGKASLFSVLRYSVDRFSRKSFHPHEKPVSLLVKLIQYASETGQTIIDPFAGSGATALACERLGRSFIGCEIDPGYFAIAQKRIAAEQSKMSLFAGIEA